MIAHNQALSPWIPPLHEIWQQNHPNYPADPELDFMPLRLWGIWIAKRNGVEIKEPVPMPIQKELQSVFTKIAQFVANNNRYRLYSLDKLEKYYKQEILQQISTQPQPQQKKMVL